MNISDPAPSGALATPSDTEDLEGGLADFLYVWVAGGLAFVTQKGETIGPYPVVAGQIIPFRVKRVLDTGTDAVVACGRHP